MPTNNKGEKSMNELAKIAEESGLPQTKSQALLEIFQEFFGVAAEWEEKAKSIKVTDETQTGLMKQAREGRKFLQNARIKLEETRKDQKKFALLEGKAIDGMANVLKASIVPVETYLKEQEDFVVNKAKAEAIARQQQAERLLQEKEKEEERVLQQQIEADRAAKEKELAEAKERELIAQKERDEAVAKQKLIDEDARKEREAHKKEIEDKQRLAFENEERIRVEYEKEVAVEREVYEKAVKKKDVELETKQIEIGELESLVDLQENEIEEVRKETPKDVQVVCPECRFVFRHIFKL